MDDDDDFTFQADLARAIAASLEPDGSGPPPDYAAGPTDGTGWSALIAAGQAASTWGVNPAPAPTPVPTTLTTTATNGTGVDAGRCSPAALLSVEEDDDDFQRQLAAAVAASLKSAEEDRRRRRLDQQAHVPPPPPLTTASSAGLVAHGAAPPHGPLAQPHYYHQQQQQGLRAGGGGNSVCCSGGLVLVPLASIAAAARGPGLAPPPPPPPPPPVPAAPVPIGAAAFAVREGAEAAAVHLMGVAGERGHSPDLAGPTPACSPCSSATDSEAGAGAAPGSAAAAAAETAVRRPNVDAATSRGVAAGTATAGSLMTLLSSSPAKHARTPSLTGASDAAQPHIKRSRSGGDGGAEPAGVGVGVGVGRPTMAVAAALATASGLSGLQPATAAAAATAGIWAGGGGGERAAAVPLQSYSPPERPASAASGCTASALAGDDVECVAATATWGLAGLTEPHQQPEPLLPSGADRRRCAAGRCSDGGVGGTASVPLSGAGGAAADAPAPPLPPLPPQGPEQLRHRRSRQQQQQQQALAGAAVAIADGCCSGGDGGGCCADPGHGGESGPSERYTLNLSSEEGGRSASGLLQHQRHLQRPAQPTQSSTGHHHSEGPCERRMAPGAALTAGGESAARASAHRRCGSVDGVAAAQGSVAPLDLSRPAAAPGGGGGGGAFLRLSDSESDPPAAAAMPAAPGGAPAGGAPAGGASSCGLPGGAATAGTSNYDQMITDSLDALPYCRPPAFGQDSAAAAALPPPPARSGMGCTGTAAADVAAAAVVGPSCGWAYSGADRRMLMNQRVWWWLGPGQVQTGRICSIDRRSEPLLYSVRLDADGGADGAAPAEAGQTIIATADCLFPYLSHGDKLMCRLPPSACDDCSGGGGGAALQQGQQRRRRLEEWPGYGSREVGAPGAEAAAPPSCAWMCGVLQHCIFDGRSPMVHVLLGPEGVPYSAPYEFVVPVSDAAEGSGCATRGSALTGPPPPGCYGPVYDTTYNNALYSDNNAGACQLDIVPIGPAA
ncbi:hypothetical protein PLESTB_001060200 [Pleodorina starrii]|uniref:Uncharacterized protein n=1 Tax=Pleodorina starrii TaxID=330485 RepID=A0A9W6BQL5_9CHLO|nr:hypothetical protein PLESTM_001277800 [Pleodorina starrii]GLC56060.1 hypothetical protein PLESTB_001060200 [Pleodorina starrii]GLC64042.1 hypothetical protein PLESTF_000112000 [Pleodorina starrii]